MTAALFGFAGVVAAALFGLAGVLRTGRPPAHMADLEGLRTLLDEMRADRDDYRSRLIDTQERNMRLEQRIEEMVAKMNQRKGNGNA